MVYILTQDQKSIVQVKEITIKENGLIGHISKTFATNWGKHLGSYESHERALEVLQEIMQAIEKSEQTKVTFTMPKQ